MSTERGADVVQLFPEVGDRDAPITKRPKEPGRRPCRHNRTEIDEEKRRLECRDCGAEVPAFDFLLKLSREDGRWREARDAAERAARIAKGQLEDLERKEKNARARVRRLEGRERDLETSIRQLDAELRAFTPEPNPKEE